jgi:pyridine nucleotide-disulfide oxidoreductase family protein
MKQLVLMGAGHAHAQVLLDWARAPVPGVQVVVVSPQALAPYSGMVPGWLAGSYRFDEIVIDFPALCAAAGARWVATELQSLDAPRRRVHLGNGEELPYDLLSLNVGSTLDEPACPGATVLPLRPLSALRTRYEALLQAWADGAAPAAGRPFHITAVGGGAAGFESLLAVQARLRSLQPGREISTRLLSRGTQLLPGIAPAARRAAWAALQRTGVQVQLGQGWPLDEAAPRTDLLLWATGAQAQAWQRDPQRRGALAVDEAGFVRVDSMLRSVSHPQVLAVGDCAAWAQPLPKAGVYAVRMGPVLTQNLRAALGQGEPRRYSPQHHFLALLATADGRAIASRGRFGLEGRWAWRWKDRIDRAFLRRFAPAGQPHTPLAHPGDPA